MSGYDVHLVGSIPMRGAVEVFETVAAQLGPRLLRIPDGETGARSQWLGWLEPVFSGHAAFEKTGQVSRPHASSDARPLHRLKDGIAADEPSFANLPIADVAISSFYEFKRLKDRGTIPRHIRFQVSVANPLSVVERFVAEDSQERAFPAYERALLGEIQKLAAAIPHDQLAIQWDVASRIMAPLEIGKPTSFGKTRKDMLREFSAMAIRWGNAVPPGIELLYHLCYGDNAHRHVVEPSSLEVPVELANAISARIGRSIELFHMPVARERSDEAYFEPLKRLTLRPQTRISLGLIHNSDGAPGTRRRIRTAEKFLNGFLIATECGFGRRPPETIPQLLAVHAEVAGIAGGALGAAISIT
jgi:hypothetical protein